jgi:hypothetical protein
MAAITAFFVFLYQNIGFTKKRKIGDIKEFKEFREGADRRGH